MADQRTEEEVAALHALGRRIVELRNRADMSQERLAELSGLDRSHVGTVEHGASDISLMRVWQLAKGFGVDPADLVEGIRV